MGGSSARERRPSSLTCLAITLCAFLTFPLVLFRHPTAARADEYSSERVAPDAPASLADGLDLRVKSLRLEARYADAAAVARDALRLRESDPGSRPHEIQSARWELALLEHVARLPAAAQAEYAQGDSLEHSLPTWSKSGWKVEAAGGAERWVAIVEKYLGEEFPETARVLAEAGTQHYGGGDYRTAEEHCRRALAIYRRLEAGEHPRVAYAMSGIGASRMHLGDLADAEPYLRGSLEMYRRTLGEENPHLCNTLHLLGCLLERQGNLSEAEELERRAVELVGSPPNVGLLNRLASILLKEGKSAEAERPLREAVKLFETDSRYQDRSLDAAETRRFLADALRARGDLNGAVSERRAGLTMARFAKGEDHPTIACFEIELAAALTERGDLAEAETLARTAAARARRTGGEYHPFHVRALLLLGRLLARQGEWRDAEQELLHAAPVFDTARLRAGEGMVRATCDLESPYADLACVDLERGGGASAWQATEHALARTLADLLFASERRGLSAEEESSEEGLGREILDLERRLEIEQEEAFRSGDPRTASAADSTAARLMAAQSQWASFRAEIAAKHPLAEGEPYALERVQSTLQPETAIVGWVDASPWIPATHAWGYVIRRDGPVSWVKLRSTCAGADPLDVMRRELLAASDWPARVPLDRAIARTAESLYELRVAPLLPHLDGVTQLIVIPAGPMIGLPLEALRDSRGRWLCDRFAISYSPSATVYAWLEGHAQPGVREGAPGTGDPRRALVIADPLFHALRPTSTLTVSAGAAQDEAALFRQALAGRLASLAELPRLPYGRKEAERIASLLPGSTLLLGADASEARLNELAESDGLRRYQLLHFATHALVDNEMPGRSALVLSCGRSGDALQATLRDEPVFDGRLTTREIMHGWRLDADLVTLSGCRTALGRHAPGEGHLGFAQALFQAGARSLLVSLWKVDDQATALLMERFYQILLGSPEGAAAARMGKSRALREAKLWLREWRDEKGNRPFEHPVYWSGFVLVGAID